MDSRNSGTRPTNQTARQVAASARAVVVVMVVVSCVGWVFAHQRLYPGHGVAL